ncbi:RNA dependent RNA Polymerase [Mirabilis jalapa mottle virus]|uniref:ORF1 protein n=1 Tax=Mirabilis jalapa mottle virus TaxID=1093773 RepID=G5CCW5_9VIRU|nr:RNA dependent RNA Polymerase [Mirabilis jalapa mottle virus]AEQ35300.1 RNA dependent RNA Polymerase [Mirabilis jalapa mottle virus]
MALTYRSPVEEVLTLLEPSAQSIIAATATTSYQQSEKENFEWFNYSLGAIAKEHLSRAGIYLSPYSGYPHSHPVCKTLENYLLYKVLPGIINNSFYFVGIKACKLNFIKRRFKNLSLVSSINRYVSSADKIRYGNEFVVRTSTEVRALRRHAGFENSATLADLVPNIKSYANLFLHDELHYWSKDDLITFLEVCKPSVMLGTVVYPPEIFIGATRSLNPWCYEFEIHKGKLLFFPDGVRAEGYEQPLNGGYLLQANKIRLPDGSIYCVDVICSKFAHHLVSITRGDMVTPSYRSFGPFEAVHTSPLNKMSRAVKSSFPVSQHTILRVYRYLRSLKKPDAQSAMAKFSQLCHEPSGEAIKFMEEFSHLVINTNSIRTILQPELIKTFFGKLGRALPAPLASKISYTRSICLDEFIACLKPLSVELTLVQLSVNTAYRILVEQDDVEEDFELHEALEDNWVGLPALERDRAPYIGLAPLFDAPSKWKLVSSEAYIMQYILRLYIQSNFNPTTGFSVSMRDYVQSMRKCASLTGRAILMSLGTQVLDDHEFYALQVTARLALWSEDPVLWFACRRAQRANLFALEEPAATFAADSFEAFTFKKQSWGSQYKFMRCDDPQMLYEEYFNCDYSSTPTLASPAVKVQVKQHAPSSEMGLQAVSCSCGLAMPVERLLVQEDLPIDFSDTLPGRSACWYSSNGLGYDYAGGQHGSKGWPRWLQLWMQANQIDGKYDCMLAQVYQEGARIGFHRDDEAVFEEGESICTVNLNGVAEFGVKCGAHDSWSVLAGNCVFTMPKGFQQTHRHSVRNTSEGRVSLTFRVLRKKKAEVLPVQVMLNDEKVRVRYEPLGEGMDYIVEPNSGGGDCFWLALSSYTGMSVTAMKQAVMKARRPTEGEPLWQQLQPTIWADDTSIIACSEVLAYDIVVYDKQQGQRVSYEQAANGKTAFLQLDGSHFEAVMPKSGCTFKALAKCLGRREQDVVATLSKQLGQDFIDDTMKGQGLSLAQFSDMLKGLGISALVEVNGQHFQLHSEGAIKGAFRLVDGHATFLEGKAVSLIPETNIYKEDVCVNEEEVLPIYSAASFVKYTPEVGRARLLSGSLVAGSTGVMCSEVFNDQPDLCPAEPHLTERDIAIILGVFGCGKSRLIKGTLRRAKRKSIVYISPRKFLCEDFKTYVVQLKESGGAESVRNFKCYTFERALLQCNTFALGSLVVLDEIQLFPPGYLDLLLLRLGTPMRVALFGDPCQSDYHSNKDDYVLGSLASDITHILRGEKYLYNTLSLRFKGAAFRGRLPCNHGEADLPEEKLILIEGLENVDSCAPTSKVCLVSSFEEKKIVNAFFGPNCVVHTFGESTGANFQQGSVLVTGVSIHTNERRWLTALSRFRERVVLVNASGSCWEILLKAYYGRALQRFVQREAAVTDLLPLLPGEPQFREGFKQERFGACEGQREEKLAGDPWLKTMIDLLQIEDVQEVEQAQALLQDEWFRTHLPQCELESVRARWVHKFLAKEHREKRMGYLTSEQFTDEHSKQLGRQLTNAAERFEAIYPRHRAADVVTFIMAVRKRLRFSHPVKEASRLMQAMPYGPFLLSEFLKRVPLKPMHNRSMMEEAKHDFEEKKVSKSAATIENHSNRSMREWAVDIGLVFSKSQLCTKFDNRFRDAKAAQTIVCFQHAVLCRFAPYMRYIEKKLNEVLPRKYYIHSGKKLEDLNEWVMEGRFDGLCTESDYEAFDASQDQYIVAFEICLMRYLGLPNDLIEDYKFIKTHLGSKLGNFAIMRFSGEASTFLFNTMANMLFTFLRYDLRGDEYICFAGDDMCANKKLHVSKKHEGFLGKLKLKAKVAISTSPTFCGWNLSSDGIYKKPQLVLERLCIAKETNNLVNCIDNYAIEVSYAYKMGEKALCKMNEEEVEAFYNCVRIIVKNKHLLKSDIIDVYRTGLVQ